MSKRHSEQFKQEVVAYALSTKDKPLKALATSLRVGYSRLDNWMQQSIGTARREPSGDQQRIGQLERENAHLRDVNEIGPSQINRHTTPLKTVGASAQIQLA